MATKLYQTTRARLALARARGDRFFGAIIAARRGSDAAVASAILAAGGRVDYRADDVSYLRARIPLNAVQAIAAQSDVVAMDADAQITVLMPPDPRGLQPALGIEAGSASPHPGSTHGPRTSADLGPLLHPYRPQDDIGLTRLRIAHPQFDGRGVTIALLDPGPDFLLPELQQARTLDGRIVPKFADFHIGESPNADDPVSPWLSITAHVRATDGAFTYGGLRYLAPHDGIFALVLAPDRGWYGALIKLMKRPMTPHSPALAILWDEGARLVYVDAGGTRDFSQARGLTDYAVHHDFGVFHVPTTDADARGTIGYVVQVAPNAHKIALLLGLSTHATMTSGTIAANEDTGGRVEGIAPEAQLISVDEGGTDSSVIESVIWAERNPRADLLCLEIISAESYGFKDGRFVESIIFDRAIRRYGKPIMQPADNEFGMSRVEEPCDVPTVTCVGAYESRASYRINSGVDVPERDNLHWVSSFGPSGDGALVPSFLAPSGWITTGPGFQAEAPAESALKGLFDLPPGYIIGGGTSQATPTAAGSAAVLIGAAREARIVISNERLLDALTRTARYLPGLDAYEQGNGLMQVDAAYAWLLRWAHRPLTRLAFDAPVKTITSPFLAVPNRGAGFFEREGWSAGERAERTLSVIRTGGSSGVAIYRLELIGNDGTFSVPGAVGLTPHTSTSIRFCVQPRTWGAHSAILRFRSSDGEIAGETLLTVVAGLRFTAQNGYTIRRRIGVPLIGPRSVFVKIPSGAQALVVRIATARQFLLMAFEGDGSAPLNRSNNLLTTIIAKPGITQSVFRFPRPGTWELELINYNDQNTTGRIVEDHLTPVALSASLADVAVRALPSGGVSVVQTGARLVGLATTQTLAFSRFSSGILARGGERVYDLRIPGGATGIFATVKSDRNASIDLYLFDCSSGICLLREKATSWGSVHQLYQDAPAAGAWKLVLDAYGVRSQARYALRTLVLDPLVSAGPRLVNAVTASIPGADPDVYYNECPPGECGELPRRAGLPPIVFEVTTP